MVADVSSYANHHFSYSEYCAFRHLIVKRLSLDNFFFFFASSTVVYLLNNFYSSINNLHR